MVNDYLITSGDFIAHQILNILSSFQFCIIKIFEEMHASSGSRVDQRRIKTSIDCSDQETKFLSWEIKKKNPHFLALCFRGNQSSRYHIIMMIKKIQWNYTPSHQQRLSLMLYNSKTWRQQDLQYSNLLDSLDFFNILTLKFLSYLKTFIFRKFIFKPTSQIIQKSWNHLFCVNFTHSFSIYCLD